MVSNALSNRTTGNIDLNSCLHEMHAEELCILPKSKSRRKDIVLLLIITTEKDHKSFLATLPREQ